MDKVAPDTCGGEGEGGMSLDDASTNINEM